LPNLRDEGAERTIAKRTTIAESRNVRKDRPSYAVPRSVPDEEEQEEQMEEERTAKATCSTRILGEKGPGCPIADPTQRLRHAPATGPTPNATLFEGAREEVLHDTITRSENAVQHPKQPLPKMEEKHSKTGMPRSNQVVKSRSRKRQKIAGRRTIPLSEVRVGLPFPRRNLGNKRAEFPIADPAPKLRHAPTTEPTATAASSACGGEEVPQDRITRLEHMVEQLKADLRNRTTLEERVAMEQVDKVRKSQSRKRKESCTRCSASEMKDDRMLLGKMEAERQGDRQVRDKQDAEMHLLRQQVDELQAVIQKKRKTKKCERNETEKKQKTEKKKKQKRQNPAEEPPLRGRGACQVLNVQLPDLSASEEEAKKVQPYGSRPTCSKRYCVQLTDAMLNGKWKHQCAHCLAMSKPKHKRKLKPYRK
jgi:hypothetical protein